jgi:hypothetical protein
LAVARNESIPTLTEAELKELEVYRNINSGAGSGELNFKDIDDYHKL